MSTDFAIRPVKRKLEEDNAALVDQRGGWFGLTSDEFSTHYSTFAKHLRIDSPFVIAELDSNKFNTLKNIVGTSNRNVFIHNKDLFEVLKGIERRIPKPRVPLFSYGHLDFCITAKVLCRDYNLIENLYWLAKWNNLKNTFFFDITFSTRGDGYYSMWSTLIEELIPIIFGTCGWEVTNPRGDGAFGIEYREKQKTGMVNAMYKVVRKRPLKVRKTCYTKIQGVL